MEITPKQTTNVNITRKEVCYDYQSFFRIIDPHPHVVRPGGRVTLVEVAFETGRGELAVVRRAGGYDVVPAADAGVLAARRVPGVREVWASA